MNSVRIFVWASLWAILWGTTSDVDAATPKSKFHRGKIASGESKDSTKTLSKGDVLLVSVSPSSDIGLKVLDSTGIQVGSVSFEHSDATKYYALTQ